MTEHGDQPAVRTPLQKAMLINEVGAEAGVIVRITDAIRSGRQSSYMNGDAVTSIQANLQGDLPLVIWACERYLASPYIEDSFKSHAQRSAWAEKNLLPLGADVLEYFKKNKLSLNMLASVASALRVFLRTQRAAATDVARYAEKALREMEVGELKLDAYTDAMPREQKKAMAQGYEKVCRTFLEKLRNEQRVAA